MGDINHMPAKGDIFRGKINDLSQNDVSGWRRRDIWFFKHDVNRKKKFRFPTRSDFITLIDNDGDRYKLNLTKPEDEEKVCIGTPSKLKPWYQKKGFDEHSIDPNDRFIFFEYTGEGNDFRVFTKGEYLCRGLNLKITIDRVDTLLKEVFEHL